MKDKLLNLALVVFLAVECGALAADDAGGVVPGKWTMDLDAAKKVAVEKKMPILLNFSGSDWCGWCKLMEKKVFSEKTWKDYAKDNIMMVIVDFPNDASLVPEKYVKRNNELKNKYGIEGFPTFIVLDDDGETVLGTLGATEDKTPASFISQLQMLFRYRPAEVARYAKSLSAADKEAYLKITGEMSDCLNSLKEQKQQLEAVQKKIGDLQNRTVELKEKAVDFRASRLQSAKHKEYKELKSKMEIARKKLTDWLATKPERNEENGAKYKELIGELGNIERKLSVY